MKRTTIAISIALSVGYVCPALAATSGPSCGELDQVAQNAGQVYNQNTGRIMDNTFHDPDPLGVQACIKDLMGIGSSIGVPDLDMGDVLDRLASRACNAAKRAKAEAFDRLNEALPTGPFGAEGVVTQTEGNRRYDKDRTGEAVDTIWGALN